MKFTYLKRVRQEQQRIEHFCVPPTYKCEYLFHCSGLTTKQWRQFKSILHTINEQTNEGDANKNGTITRVTIMPQSLSRTKIPGPQKRLLVYCKQNKCSNEAGFMSTVLATVLATHTIDCVDKSVSQLTQVINTLWQPHAQENVGLNSRRAPANTQHTTQKCVPSLMCFANHFILLSAQTEWARLNHLDCVFASNPNVCDQTLVLTRFCTQCLSSPLEYFSQLIVHIHNDV
jgi:hypothetical protein